jgi:hypothetical protein
MVPKLVLAHAPGTIAQPHYVNSPFRPEPGMFALPSGETHVFKRLLHVLAHLLADHLRVSCAWSVKRSNGSIG